MDLVKGGREVSNDAESKVTIGYLYSVRSTVESRAYKL